MITTLALLQAMERHSVKRLICITGIGAGDSRADVAAFVLQQLTDDRYLHQTPLISY